MLFLEFFLSLGLMALAFSLVYVNIAAPFFGKIRKTLAPGGEATDSVLEERAGRLALLIGTVLLAATEAYLQSAWSAYCVKRTLALVILPESTNWVYYIVGFLLCEAALGYIAVKDRANGIIEVFRSVIPMGAFVAFAVDASRIDIFYGWITRLFAGGFWPFS